MQPAARIYGWLVLEITIREPGKKQNIENKEFEQLTIKLCLAGKITKPFENSLRADYGIGSWAAHNNSEFSKLKNRQIKEFLDFIRDIVLTIK